MISEEIIGGRAGSREHLGAASQQIAGNHNPSWAAAASAWGIEAAVHTYDLSLEQVRDLDVWIYLSLVVNPFDPETEETQELRFVTDKVS
ncbi:hypothetical protein AB7M29_004711 [Pseudomonas sp. F-14 TE3623]|jgi:hypothetical protein